MAAPKADFRDILALCEVRTNCLDVHSTRHPASGQTTLSLDVLVAESIGACTYFG